MSHVNVSCRSVSLLVPCPNFAVQTGETIFAADVVVGRWFRTRGERGVTEKWRCA